MIARVVKLRGGAYMASTEPARSFSRMKAIEAARAAVRAQGGGIVEVYDRSYAEGDGRGPDEELRLYPLTSENEPAPADQGAAVVYIAKGAEAGSCGHDHATPAEAVTCLEGDRRLVAIEDGCERPPTDSEFAAMFGALERQARRRESQPALGAGVRQAGGAVCGGG